MCPQRIILMHRKKASAMNHPIDYEPETQPRQDSKYLKLLEVLIDNIIESLQDKSCKPKVRDALMAIQLREKVAKTSEAEQIFWDMIDDIRNSELSQPTSLETQIQETIFSLKDQVKNGILPVKSITDAFNQDRSQQTRLTYRRMGTLLSAMGFTKARTPNGCFAIIWDDKLLTICPPDQGESKLCSDTEFTTAGGSGFLPARVNGFVHAPGINGIVHASNRRIEK